MVGGHDPRLRLAGPLAVLIGVVWFAMAVLLVAGGDALGFEVTTGPFTLLCGWMFGGRMIDSIVNQQKGGR